MKSALFAGLLAIGFGSRTGIHSCRAWLRDGQCKVPASQAQFIELDQCGLVFGTCHQRPSKLVWSPSPHGCPCRKSDPDILMVKPAQHWLCGDASDRLDGTCDRCILA